MSGIYINGLDLPEKGTCKTITIFDDGAVVEGNGSEILGKAILVPPHGRGIDADALMTVAEPIKDHRGNVKRVVWDAHINRQPTIIPADPPVMYYPQVPGITPTLISEDEE